jgi:hypothetical protein
VDPKVTTSCRSLLVQRPPTSYPTPTGWANPDANLTGKYASTEIISSDGIPALMTMMLIVEFQHMIMKSLGVIHEGYAASLPVADTHQTKYW